MYKINVEGLTFSACHGVNPEEKVNPQTFKVDAVLTVTGRVGSDSIENTVSYAKVAKTVRAVVTGESVDLIETLAENVAKEIILGYPGVEAVSVTVSKPQAPISIPFDNVSVTVERHWSRVYVSAGSNLGDRKQHLEFGLSRLEERHTRVVRTAALIETEPYGNVDQPLFLNGMIELNTILEPAEFLTFLHEIEAADGRVRTERWGARTLDLDIIFFGDVVMNTDALTIPHADMLNRRFVLEPLAEIAPNVIHPVKMQTVRELLAELNGR